MSFTQIDKSLRSVELRCDVADLILLSVVALLEDIPEHRLVKGQAGTLVESLGPDVWEVEFSDERGQTYASLPLRAGQLLELLYEPVDEPAGRRR